MRGPLVILALLSIGGGWIGIDRFAAFLAPVTGTRTAESAFDWRLFSAAPLWQWPCWVG